MSCIQTRPAEAAADKSQRLYKYNLKIVPLADDAGCEDA